jgi:hypothetical protein
VTRQPRLALQWRHPLEGILILEAAA